MKRERLSDHRLARPGGADEEEVAALGRRDAGEVDGFVLADHTSERVMRDLHLRGAVDVLKGEAPVGGERLLSDDGLSLT